jgi:antitoxin component YwqK of YwqJK toxin-antitoxin module
MFKFYIAYIFFILFPLGIIAQERAVNIDDLERRDGLMYVKGEDVSYTGKAYLFYKSKEKGMAGDYKDGKKHGEWVWWYKNGNKKRYSKYDNGNKQGVSIYWYKNGVKKSEMVFDKNINIKQTSWNEKGERIPNPTLQQYR